ncbi:hypothetical protein PanWU01x14_281050 [Parasponia andersonii]|uniref:Uncharacterized protein n=1 Tax=Parasponia andersonii TaxID=3476 RepID=A0A2P5B162_PARAD|nr:hypothetical protein PanWU01x14_281050 [Parasponia andersonii]
MCFRITLKALNIPKVLHRSNFLAALSPLLAKVTCTSRVDSVKNFMSITDFSTLAREEKIQGLNGQN